MSTTKFSMPTASEFLREHFIWTLGLVPFVIAAINIMSISAGDPQVFAYLLQNLNLVSLIIGAILPLVPMAVVWTAIGWISERMAVPKQDRKEIDMIYTPFVALFMVVAVLALQVSYLIMTAFWLAFIHNGRQRTKRKNRRNQSRYGVDVRLEEVARPDLRFVMLFITFLIAQNLFIVKSDWIPHESLSIKGKNAISGQILASDRQWTTFLAGDKKIQIVRTEDVMSRSPCYTSTSFLSKTIGTLLAQSATHQVLLHCPT